MTIYLHYFSAARGINITYGLNRFNCSDRITGFDIRFIRINIYENNISEFALSIVSYADCAYFSLDGDPFMIFRSDRITGFDIRFIRINIYENNISEFALSIVSYADCAYFSLDGDPFMIF